MNFWERRKIKKAVHHLLHEARHARHMREDIVEPARITALEQAEQELSDAWDQRDERRIDAAAEQIAAAITAVQPPHRSPRIRENIEIIVVAIAVAMAFRTFFVQPFRIPTGSMQPTLYGITYAPQQGPGWMDRFPLKIIPFLLWGESYTEIKAKAAGAIEFRGEQTDDGQLVLRIAGVPHLVPIDMPMRAQVRETVQKGQVIAAGRKRLGDHIFVNRIRYNFTPPERGDIFVFSTKDIRHPNIRPDNYYIKRLVGLPGERMEIRPPFLYADDQKVEEPEAFRRQLQPPYEGYILVGNIQTEAILRRAGDSIQLGVDEYLPLGDNTMSSLDGRYFGGVNKHNIVGPAFMIYWPFTHRWGSIQ
ncbi:MAG TPA: signal peptidase I [Kiritimatiellia bacterium]|nr:signal peptidase I [Kiritimatiellia bacterium]HMP34294.1 signal peptidase I [Kiritimatiellia bacterium]